MKYYYADFWELYGLTPLTIWDLPADDFFPMTKQADAERRRREKEQKPNGR